MLELLLIGVIAIAAVFPIAEAVIEKDWPRALLFPSLRIMVYAAFLLLLRRELLAEPSEHRMLAVVFATALIMFAISLPTDKSFSHWPPPSATVHLFCICSVASLLLLWLW